MDIDQFRNVLVLAPHTDDGEFGCGGTMARLIEGGATVTYAAFSHGVALGAARLPARHPHDRGARGDRRSSASTRRTFWSTTSRCAPSRPCVRTSSNSSSSCSRSSTPTASSCRPWSTCTRTTRRSPKRACAPSSAPPCSAYEIPWNNLNFNHQAYVRLEARHVQKKVEALACYKSQQHRNYVREDYIRNVAFTRAHRRRLRVRRGLRGLPLDHLSACRCAR